MQVKTRDSEGCSPLFFTAANGHTDVVHALVSAGAVLTHRIYMVLLHFAILCGSLAIYAKSPC